MELVVPESPTTQDSPAEEQQPEDHGIEDKTNEEHLPPSDTKSEKMYRDADEVESFEAESPILAGRLRALLEHLGSTTAPRNRVKKSRIQGEWSSRPSQIFSSDLGSSADTRDQPSGLHAAMLLPMPPDRPSHRGSIATRAGCRTRSTTSYLPEEGSIQGLRGEKGYSPDGDGTPPGCDGGAKRSSADRSVRDRDSSHPTLKHRCHHPRL
jgi:hypothetical protein